MGFATGFAAACAGIAEPLVAAGAQLWEGWRQQSDEKFVKSFGQAVDSFIESAGDFSEKTEEALEKAAWPFLASFSGFYKELLGALEELSDKMDLTDIHKRLHFPTPDDSGEADEDVREFFEIVLSNLREARLSSESEGNLREMLGLTASS